MRKTIVVHFKASDFEKVDFISNTDCALARAIKRTLGSDVKRVNVTPTVVKFFGKRIGEGVLETYNIYPYFGISEFEEAEAKFKEKPRSAKYSVKLFKQEK